MKWYAGPQHLPKTMPEHEEDPYEDTNKGRNTDKGAANESEEGREGKGHANRHLLCTKHEGEFLNHEFTVS